MRLKEFVRIMEDDSGDLERFADAVKRKYGLEEFELYPDRRGNIELSMIRAPKDERGEGAGTAAMEELVRYADANRKLVWLSVADKDSRTGTTSKGRLMKFYRRFGFVPNQGRHKDFSLSMYANMYRIPR
jgi:GNAT superfamily N-acetyltransferase